MSFYAVIKKNAKIALKGRWGAAAGAFAFVLGVALLLAVVEQTFLRVFVPPPFPADIGQVIDYAYFLQLLLSYSLAELFVTAMALTLFLLLFAPLILGLTRWFYLLIQEERPVFLDIFYFFENARRYGRSVWYLVQLCLRAFGWGVVFLSLPGGLMSICVRFLRIETLSRQAGAAASAGVVLALGLFLLMALLYAIYLSKYSLAAYLLCESDEISVREAFRTSIQYTRGYRGVKFLFTLSFIGWYLLLPITFFLALLFVVPYHSAGKAVFARYLVEKNRYREPQITRQFGGPVQSKTAEGRL